MTTNSTTAEDRLANLGIHVPDAPTPFGAYVPAVQTGNLLLLSGVLATSGHTATHDTMAPCVVIGERAAEILEARHKL
jgi:enamine deaminase RidA (YjgF/YER057c/UK114 family)